MGGGGPERREPPSGTTWPPPSDQLRVPLLGHLDEEEEEHILPLADEHIAPEEWDQLAEHGRRAFPKSKLFSQLGSILEDATPRERDAFLAKLPKPVVLMWRLVGPRPAD